MEMKAGLLTRLAAETPNMPPILRKLATYIHDNANQATRQTVEDVALAAGCSEGTVMRLCKDLGLAGFQDLKLTLAVEVDRREGASGRPGSRRSIVERTIEATQEAVSETRHLVNDATLRKVAGCILRARRIHVFGVGASAYVAGLLEYKLARFGLPAHALSDTHMGFMLGALLRRGDVMIGVSSSGSTIDVVNVVDAAKARGATAITLTNRPRSRLSKIADHTLCAAMPEEPLSGGAIRSKITQLMLIDMLTETILEQRPAVAAIVKATAAAATRSSY